MAHGETENQTEAVKLTGTLWEDTIHYKYFQQTNRMKPDATFYNFQDTLTTFKKKFLLIQSLVFTSLAHTQLIPSCS